MPTAAKLFGAILFMALSWLLTYQVMRALGTSSGMALLGPGNAVIGIVMGWRLSGARAGNGVNAAIGDGLTTVCVMYFWGVLIWSAWEMLKRSIRMRYDNPIEAIYDLAMIMIEYSNDVITAGFVFTAVIGSVIAGVIVEKVAQRWP